MRFVIVTGVSGAGKTAALKMLEDANYFCVDNLPIPLLEKFASLMPEIHGEDVQNVALGIDARSGRSLDELEAVLDRMKKAGYEFEGWFYGPDLENPWYFDINKVSEDVTLTARWTPAKVTVRFDLDGGIWSEADQEKMRAGTDAGADSLEVTFGENYGVLPVPVKEGAVFDGWRYSGQNITEDTKVTVNGEHVLTAQWK